MSNWTQKNSKTLCIGWISYHVQYHKELQQKCNAMTRDVRITPAWLVRRSCLGSCWHHLPRFFVEAVKAIYRYLAVRMQDYHQILIAVFDRFVKLFTGRHCYTVCDWCWGFNARKVDPRSWPMTMFQTPLELLQITSLPTGYQFTSRILRYEFHLAEWNAV